MFASWKEMDQYMRENKIEGVRATVVKPEPPVEEIVEDAKPKGSDKPSAKPAAKAAAH